MQITIALLQEIPAYMCTFLACLALYNTRWDDYEHTYNKIIIENIITTQSKNTSILAMMKETKKKRDEIIVQEINSWPHTRTHTHLSSFQGGGFPFIAVAELLVCFQLNGMLYLSRSHFGILYLRPIPIFSGYSEFGALDRMSSLSSHLLGAQQSIYKKKKVRVKKNLGNAQNNNAEGMCIVALQLFAPCGSYMIVIDHKTSLSNTCIAV